MGSPDEKPYTTLVLTGADKGIDNKLVKLNDFATKLEVFGRSNYTKYGQASLQADVLLQNGQTSVWFMRVLPKDARYANLVVVAHYRKPKCVLPDYDPLVTPPDPNDCEILAIGGTATAPTYEPTGLKRLEVKYSIVNVTAKLNGAGHPTDDSVIEEYINGRGGLGDYVMPRGPLYTEDQARVYNRTPADLEGFYSVPIFYSRVTGRGKYGNRYALRLLRDTEFEFDNDIKSYGFNLIERDFVTKSKHYFVGTMVASGRYDRSMLVDDVLGAYPLGSVPIFIKTYESAIAEILDAYRDITAYNTKIIAEKYAKDQEKLDDLKYAMGLVVDLEEKDYSKMDLFDPIFGYRLNDREKLIPYFANFTPKTSIPLPKADYTVLNKLPVEFENGDPLWDTFVDASDEAMLLTVGDRILVKNFLSLGSDTPLEGDGSNRMHKLFTVKDIEITWDEIASPAVIESFKVTYDEGLLIGWDDYAYTGVNLGSEVGFSYAGGFDGEFEEIIAYKRSGGEITGEQVERPPNAAEMKLLLSREYVSALRGEKDKYILSPARINLDFIIDANYNLCADIEVNIPGVPLGYRELFANSQVITNEEYRQLVVLDSMYQFGTGNLADALNVKKALWALNNYRNKNGIVNSKEEGAGCALKLDCGLIGIGRSLEIRNEGGNFKAPDIGNDLRDLLQVMNQFDGRNCSIDFGHYEIIDPVSRRKVPVTATFFLAEELIPHMVRFGPNKPFVNIYAQISNMVRNSFKPELDLIDWDVKELLYNSRINYYLTFEEGRVVQRAVQNTCQKDASALLEENNVNILNLLLKGLEKACRSYLYEWSDPVVRKGYTDTQMEIYKPWIGNWVEGLSIYFDANAYEEERMLMHCYAEVKFRNITKRIVLEIDINKPTGGAA